MIVYHGSSVVVEHPDVLHSYHPLDFGKGFYVTTVYEQAERWARRKASLLGTGKAVVNQYQLRDDTLTTGCWRRSSVKQSSWKKSKRSKPYIAAAREPVQTSEPAPVSLFLLSRNKLLTQFVLAYSLFLNQLFQINTDRPIPAVHIYTIHT